MTHLDIASLVRAEAKTDPFPYIIVQNFLRREPLRRVIDAFPHIKAGSYPLEAVTLPHSLGEVINELESAEFERTIEEKFGVELSGRPKMYSLRGYCRATDGKIHTDSKDKIITVLLYLNDTWHHQGGRLRLLRNNYDLEAFADEVPPDNGTLLVFKCVENSWHGHDMFEGVRRSIQMNWMVSDSKRSFHRVRHRLSAAIKRVTLNLERRKTL